MKPAKMVLTLALVLGGSGWAWTLSVPATVPNSAKGPFLDPRATLSADQPGDDRARFAMLSVTTASPASRVSFSRPSRSDPFTTNSKPHTSPFVTRCGLALCRNGRLFALYGASTLFVNNDPTGTMVAARAQGLNTVRLVNFLDEAGNPKTAPFDRSAWERVDRDIALAASRGLTVILDLSTYRNLLRRHWNPYTVDWGPFIRWVTHRRNTVSGLLYKDDPAIAMVAIAGEPDGPNMTEGRQIGLTTQQLTDFYARTSRAWKAADPHHIVSTGGLLQLNWDSGIDWRAIGAINTVDVVAIHAYSDDDRTKVLPAVASWTHQHGKPWLLEEFGETQSVGDAARASYFHQMIDAARGGGAAGISFWNLGPEVLSGSHDVNPSTPLTWKIVKAMAPGH